MSACALLQGLKVRLQGIRRSTRTPGVSKLSVALHVDAGFVRALCLVDGIDPEEDGVAC